MRAKYVSLMGSGYGEAALSAHVLGQPAMRQIRRPRGDIVHGRSTAGKVRRERMPTVRHHARGMDPICAPAAWRARILGSNVRAQDALSFAKESEAERLNRILRAAACSRLPGSAKPDFTRPALPPRAL